MIDQDAAVNVPDGAATYRCPYCERAFSAERLRTLHKGLDHPDRIDDAERDAFQDAYRGENEAIKTFRLKVLGGLVVLYFLFLFAYMLVG